MVLLDDARRCHCCERRGKGREERPEEVMWKLSNQAFHLHRPSTVSCQVAATVSRTVVVW
jgi:hypothetical protein